MTWHEWQRIWHNDWMWIILGCWLAGSAILEALGGVLSAFGAALGRGLGVGRRPKVVVHVQQAAPPQKLPGRCVHRQVSAIVPSGEEAVVGWLCRSCGTQLPADWAVREEDL